MTMALDSQGNGCYNSQKRERGRREREREGEGDTRTGRGGGGKRGGGGPASSRKGRAQLRDGQPPNRVTGGARAGFRERIPKRCARFGRAEVSPRVSSEVRYYMPWQGWRTNLGPWREGYFL